MSHEVEKMAYTGQPAWHGLGQSLPPNASLEIWAAAAGLEWEAVPSPLTASMPVGPEPEEGEEDARERIEVDVPGSRALIRSDNHEVLSTVSKQYKPVQPSEVIEFFSDYVKGLDAGFAMETAGCLKGGKKIWALAKCVDGRFTLGDNDHIDQYLLLATSFDRSLPTIASLTSVRVVCSNTLRVATSDKANQLRVTHNRKFDGDMVKEALGLKDQWEVFAEECAAFNNATITVDESRKYIAEVLINSNPHKKKEYDDSLAKMLDGDDELFNRLMEIRTDAPGQDMAVGTVFGDLNAITYWADHEIKAKDNDNRWDSACFGRGKRTKEMAYNLAKELVS